MKLKLIRFKLRLIFRDYNDWGGINLAEGGGLREGRYANELYNYANDMNDEATLNDDDRLCEQHLAFGTCVQANAIYRSIRALISPLEFQSIKTVYFFIYWN